jgi:hypothetical protein
MYPREKSAIADNLLQNRRTGNRGCDIIHTAPACSSSLYLAPDSMLKTPNKSNRIAREKKTVERMIALYCHAHHSKTGRLCPECAGLSAYASQRLESCKFGAVKPTCARCPVHCYHQEKRDYIRRVMRYAGPRMMLYHPLLSTMHLMDGLVSTRNFQQK